MNNTQSKLSVILGRTFDNVCFGGTGGSGGDGFCVYEGGAVFVDGVGCLGCVYAGERALFAVGYVALGGYVAAVGG
jgi:hypothetical protein